MNEVTKRTLGHKDVFYCVVRRLSPCDAVAYMCACKRLKELGIGWLKRNGRAWIPQVDSSWTWKELRVAALLAFGKPEQIYEMRFGAHGDADVSRHAFWTATPLGVIIHAATEDRENQPPSKVINYPPLLNKERPRINVYECGGQAVGVVSVGGKLGLVPEEKPKWITLCDKPSYYAVDSRTDAKWIVTTLRMQEGVVFSWANLRTIVKTGKVEWRSSPVPPELIGDAHVLPNLHFTGTDALVILKLLASNEETARLSLTSGKWSKRNRGVKHPVWQPYWGEPVHVGGRIRLRLCDVSERLSLRRHDQGYNPVMRTFSDVMIPSIHSGTKLRALSFNGKALIYVQTERIGRLFSLTPTDELPELQDVIRANSPLPIVSERTRKFRDELNQLDMFDLFVGALSGDLRPVFPSKEGLHGRLQRLLVLAIEGGRPDICTLLVAELVQAKSAPLKDFSLQHAFEYACGRGQAACAFALLNSGALKGRTCWERVEEWPLARGLELALHRQLWGVVKQVLTRLERQTEPNKLLSMLIMQMPSLLRVKLATQLISRLGLWVTWDTSYPIDLVTEWGKDQLEWEELCRKQDSICWQLIVELRQARQYPTLRKLICCWLDSPLAPGARAALRSLLKLNPTARKRCKR